jgi:putative transposase
MRGKAIVEATFSAINTLWCQHLAGYTGRDTTRRGRRPEAEAAWTIPELQDLLGHLRCHVFDVSPECDSG